jgi:hypothetical protein
MLALDIKIEFKHRNKKTFLKVENGKIVTQSGILKIVLIY